LLQVVQVLADVQAAQLAPHAEHTPPAVDVAVENVPEGHVDTHADADKA
jgi:hypothetical protein